MVQAAKLIGAGSALIALAGVGAGIGIVFGSCALVRCCVNVAVLTACIAFAYIYSKAHSPCGFRKRPARSGSESRVSAGSWYNTLCFIWRASSSMAKLINLNYMFSVTKNTVIYISLSDYWIHGPLTGIKEGLAKVESGAAHFF